MLVGPMKNLVYCQLKLTDYSGKFQSGPVKKNPKFAACSCNLTEDKATSGALNMSETYPCRPDVSRHQSASTLKDQPANLPAAATDDTRAKQPGLNTEAGTLSNQVVIGGLTYYPALVASGSGTPAFPPHSAPSLPTPTWAHPVPIPREEPSIAQEGSGVQRCKGKHEYTGASQDPTWLPTSGTWLTLPKMQPSFREWADVIWYYANCCGKLSHDAQLQQNKHNCMIWFPMTSLQDYPDGSVIDIQACPAFFYVTMCHKGHPLSKCPLKRNNFTNREPCEGRISAGSRRGNHRMVSTKHGDDEKS